MDRATVSNLDDYLDARVAPARAQGRDRFFTYATSIAEENALINSGSSAGFGIRLSYDTVGRRLFVVEAYEGAAALAAGIDRGTEITAIGTSSANLQSVSSLFASGGSQAVADGSNIRRMALMHKIPYYTLMTAAAAGVQAITVLNRGIF